MKLVVSANFYERKNMSQSEALLQNLTRKKKKYDGPLVKLTTVQFEKKNIGDNYLCSLGMFEWKVWQCI